MCIERNFKMHYNIHFLLFFFQKEKFLSTNFVSEGSYHGLGLCPSNKFQFELINSVVLNDFTSVP